MFALQCGICFIGWLGLGFLIANRLAGTFAGSSRSMRVGMASLSFVASAIVLLGGLALTVGMNAITKGTLSWAGFTMVLLIGTGFVTLQALAMKLLVPERAKSKVTDSSSQPLPSKPPKS